jgi:geranylgeranyl diphosphate synthase type II
MKKVSFPELFQARRDQFDLFFQNEVIPTIRNYSSSRLSNAIIYNFSSGKKIRPLLCISAFLSGSNKITPSYDSLFLASALECIHTYSLIHDDLPSMDNDTLRRGKPTCHVAYGEDLAILAGDALNSLGFFLVSKVIPRAGDEKLTSDLLRILHDGAGLSGMVDGQVIDLAVENQIYSADEQILLQIHSKKTGALIRASMLLGNRLRSDYSDRVDFIKQYADDLGILFQLTDDILDETGSHESLGKTPGKDRSTGKLTFVSLYGLEKSKKIANELVEKLINTANNFEPSTEIFFKELPIAISQRKS